MKKILVVCMVALLALNGVAVAATRASQFSPPPCCAAWLSGREQNADRRIKEEV